MKKLLVILFLLGFGLYNYKLIHFKNGFNYVNLGKTNEQYSSSFLDQISYLSSIQSIYYYNNPLGDDYILVIHSTSGIEIGKVDQEDINYLNTVGIFIKRVAPQKVSTIPLAVFGIAILMVVLYNPQRKKQL
jgi:hypothetical protein